MTRDGALSVARLIDEVHLEPICARVQRTDNGVDLSHLRWMVSQMNTMSENKTMRWLGYIQGVLVARYGVPLMDMKLMSAAYAEKNK